MQIPRHHAWLLAFTLALASLTCRVVASAEVTISVDKLADHPRLFADSERWKQLRGQVQTDRVSRRLLELVQARALGTLELPSLQLEQKGINLHGPMRQIQGRIACLAMMYRLTDDERFLARARQEMRELAETPHWRPGHFLSTAEATVAMSIGVDWLWNELSVDERQKFSMAIVEKGLRPSLEAELKGESWLTSGGNWGPVCHGGMAIGALTVLESEPELAQRVIARSIAGVAHAAARYAPAGAHSEGPGYWAYGTNFYFMLVDALRTSLGSSFELEKAPGLLKTGDYNIQMTTPTGRMFSYGDSVPEFGFEPVMFWLARELNRHDLAAPTLDRLNDLEAILVSDAAQPDASRLQPLALLWWNPELKAAGDASGGPLRWWSEGGPQPQAVMRSSWNDPRAAYVGIKGGSAMSGHGHMDAGSFVYEADGVRWAHDLGRDLYSGPRQHGLGGELFREHQDSKRWAIFRNGPESHNILRFNSAAPWVEGRAEIRPARNRASSAFVVDLTPAYTGQVETVHRGFVLASDRSLIIRDEWKTLDHPALVTFQWMTTAATELTPNDVMLSESGESLTLSVEGTGGPHIAVEDWSRAPNRWDSPNPNLKRITIRTGTPAHSSGHLILTARPGGATTVNTQLRQLPLEDW